MILENENTIRKFENTDYFGYLFHVSYDGLMFDSFDENPDMISVKSKFRELLESNNIKFYKGIQQAGRTDKDVSASNNILYVNSKQDIKLSGLKNFKTDGLTITKIEKTMPFLEIPSLIKSRHYVYKYPTDKIANTKDEINKTCESLSGEKNFKKFTTKKGEQLKNHIRNIEVTYTENNELHYIGDSFLPQQVRIMSGYILTNKLKPLEGKYLILYKVNKSDELNALVFTENNEIKIDKVERVEQNSNITIFFVKAKNKAELIGKNGKNIKQMRKEYGNIVVKILL